MKNNIKLALEFIPLIIFFIANSNYGIFIATISFMLATTIAVPTLWFLTKKIPYVPIIGGVFILFFGGLTLILQDDIFIKLKVTIVNFLFGTILMTSILLKKNLLRYIMGSAIEMTEKGWETLTIRWAGLFFFLGILNEIIWRTQTTDFWVSFKVFGIMPITLIFALLQIPLLKNESNLGKNK